MKIGTPTNDVPGHAKGSRGKYKEIYAALSKLSSDKWLPVQFPTPHDAYNFRVATTQYRALRLEAKLRGSAVYVRVKREAKNGSRMKDGARSK